MNVELDPVKYLPYDASSRIFFYLDVQQLGRCCLVSKAWSEFASRDSFWIPLLAYENVPRKTTLKSYCMQHSISSMYALVMHIQEFIKYTKPNQIGKFTCIFPHNPDYSINLEWGYGQVNSKKEPNATHFLAYLKKIYSSEKIPQIFHRFKNQIISFNKIPLCHVLVKPSIAPVLYMKTTIILPKDYLDLTRQISGIVESRLKDLSIEDESLRGTSTISTFIP